MIKFFDSTTILVITLLLSIPNVAYGTDEMTTVEKGDIVPFNGTLFNTSASAKLLIDLDFTEATCKIEIDKNLADQDAENQFEIGILEARIKTCESICEKRLQIRDEQIEFLVTELERKRHPNQTAWFATGAVTGIGLTVLSGWAIGQAAPN